MPKYAKPNPEAAAEQKRSMTPWIIGASLLFLGLIALAVFLNSPRRSAASVEAPDVPAEWVDRNVLGNPEAVVTVQSWEDFLCPACQQWATQIKPRLLEDYVNDGQVKLEFRHFPLTSHSPGAQMGAMATECAADQAAFWPYHDVVFIEAANRGQSGVTLERLTAYARQMGLNESEFLQCMNSQRHRDAVNASVSEGISLGVNSTPTILINGQPMANPFDYSELQQNVDRLLEAADSDS
jgi:protein-disulfide isomerase